METRMDLSAIAGNILNPPVMFFFLGLGVIFFKSDLRVPENTAKFLSLYLLFSIGFKGGHELYHNPFEMQQGLTLIACIFMSLVVPIYSFFIFRTKLDIPNAAALAASFGSISAVTFVTAGAFLHNINITYQGFIVAGMAIMESPAIIMGVILDRVFKSRSSKGENKIVWSSLLHESFFSASVYILLGALLVGYVSGEKGWETTKPFSEDIFKGFLIFFLLDKGIHAASGFKDLKKVGWFLILASLGLLIINATVGILLSKFIGMAIGDALMFTVLCASASYIAVPAAMKDSIPDANPGIYITVALSIIFPINVILGIPLFYYLLTAF